jgi:hypothetical protein
MVNATLKSELDYLSEILRDRLSSYFNGTTTSQKTIRVDRNGQDDALTRFRNQFNLTTPEYITFLAALAPHVQPSFFDTLIHEFMPGGGEFT